MLLRGLLVPSLPSLKTSLWRTESPAFEAVEKRNEGMKADLEFTDSVSFVILNGRNTSLYLSQKKNALSQKRMH